MKAPARISGPAPHLPLPAVSAHRWRRVLLPAAGVVLALLAVAVVVAWLDHAEGDLRQVSAPAALVSSTATA